ncbi:MAG: hypothetical protein RJA70_1261, partial [Pseudomonadota bacterium]
MLSRACWHHSWLGRLGLGLVLTLGSLSMTSVAPDALAQEETRVGNQNGGMDTHLFRPALDSKGFLTMNGTDVLGADDISFGLVLDYGRNLLRTNGDAVPSVLVGGVALPCDLGECSGGQVPAGVAHGVPALVQNSFQGTFAFNYGIGNVAVVGIQVPVVMMAGDATYNVGPATEFGGANYNTVALDQQGIGTVALHGKLRLTRVEKTVGLALMLQAGLPTGDANKDLGADPGVWFWPQAALEHRFGATGRFRVGANVGFRGHTGDNAGFGSSVLEEGAVRHGNLGTFSAGLAWRAL